MECAICGKKLGYNDQSIVFRDQRLCYDCYKYFNLKDDSVSKSKRLSYFKDNYHTIEKFERIKNCVDEWLEIEDEDRIKARMESAMERAKQREIKIETIDDSLKLLAWEWWPDSSTDFSTFTNEIKENIYDFVKSGWKIISYNLTSCTHGTVYGRVGRGLISPVVGKTQGTTTSSVYCQCLMTRIDGIIAK